MIYFVGDVVKLRSGETGEIVEIWGVAMTWHKVKTVHGNKFASTEQIESVIKRFSNKKRSWGK
ncbi:hypothetical protein B1748_29000 [Paenibacillus sp. MY03]|nr:hypothetical protein B1748_29000 [Paenibacillus sp. MY03]